MSESGDRCPACGAGVDGSWLVCAWCGGPLAAPAELAAGDLLDDRYLVRRVIGRGGFGITYEARDERLKRRVAVKELFPPSAVRHGSVVLAAPRDRDSFRQARERFLREAQVLARFTQPGIVHVYEVFEEHNTAYLVMELLTGCTLADLLRIRGAPFDAAEVLDLAARVAPALDSVHEAGLLHRDVNPSNVMLTDSGRVVLIDFGLARSFDAPAGESMTRAVTPGYAPPEQYAGTGEFGPSCDVYGLAATLYRLLTGRIPVNAFERSEGAALPSPADLEPSVPRQLSDAVLDGLELNPQHRPATASAFLDRLGLHGVVPSGRPRLLDDPAVVEALERPGASGEVAPRTPARPPTPTPEPASGRAPAPVRAPAPAPVRAPGPVRPPVAAALAPLPDRDGAAGAAHAFRAPAPVPAPVAAGPPVPPPVMGAPRVTAAPRTEPPIVGPLPRGRAWVTVPAGLAATALASAAPVVVVPLLVLAGLPALATVGDVVMHRYRRDTGGAQRSFERLDDRAAMPLFALRNVAMSVLRGAPGLALLLAGGGVAHLAADPGVESLGRDLLLRVTGVGATLSLLVPARSGGRRFRSGTGIDRVVNDLVDVRGRLRFGGWVALVVSVAVAAFGLLLHPELWPLNW